MKILALIPAREGSKGVPGKNIKMLGNKPLIQYTIESAKESKLLTDIVVSTDGLEIADLAKKLNIDVPFMRPSQFASDTASSFDVVIHAIETLEQEGKFFDAVCLLQPTYPFREKGLIDKAILQFINHSSDSLISVLPVPHEFNPHWVFEPNLKNHLVIATGDLQIIKRRQDLPGAYYRDGSIYLTKVDVLKNQKSLYGLKIGYIESNYDYYVNIDTLKDWKLAEKKLKLLFN